MTRGSGIVGERVHLSNQVLLTLIRKGLQCRRNAGFEVMGLVFQVPS
jgi:hypothetical protein